MNIPYTFVTNQWLRYAPPFPVAAPPATTCTGGIGPTLATLGNANAGHVVASMAALVNCAQMIGVYPGDPTTIQGALLNAYEMSWREFSLKAAAWPLANGSYGRTPILDAVDASEKAVLSFQVGQVFCALVAQLAGTLPGVFMHLERWRRVYPLLALQFRSNRVPDFISWMGPNGFQAWEAKARLTNGVNWAALRDGFDQAWSLASVGGLAPTAHVATLARTAAPNGSPWEIYVVDPGQSEPAPLEPAVEDAIFREYYAPFVSIIDYTARQGRELTFGGVKFFAVPRNGADAWLGIDMRILETLRADRSRKLLPGDLAAALLRILGEGYVNPPSATRRFINLNGILTVVGESWLAL